MLVKLLDPDPKNRPSAEELLKNFDDKQFLEYLS